MICKENKLIIEYLKNKNPNLENINWDMFLKNARNESYLEILYSKIKDIDQIPERVKSELKKNIFFLTRRRLIFKACIQQIHKEFKKKKIDFILLKGFALEKKIYRPFQRFSEDIDIFVRKKDIDKSVKILKNMGYSSKDSIFPEDYYKDYKHHFFFSKKKKPQAKVELHWSLVEQYAPFKLTEKELFSTAQHINLDGIKIKVLSNEYLLLHLCLHFLYVHPFSSMVKASYEIATFIRKNKVDFEKFLKISELTETTSFTYYALFLSRNLFNEHINEELFIKLKKKTNKITLILLKILTPVKFNKKYGYTLRKWILKLLLAKSIKKKKVIGDMLSSYKYEKQYVSKKQ